MDGYRLLLQTALLWNLGLSCHTALAADYAFTEEPRSSLPDLIEAVTQRNSEIKAVNKILLMTRATTVCRIAILPNGRSASGSPQAASSITVLIWNDASCHQFCRRIS